MWIVASFTRDGSPATGLSPTVVVRDVDTSGLVINGAPMDETGDGFYSYDFSAYNPLKDYTVVCDSVTLSGVERYSYASTGEYNEVLDSIDSTMGVVDLRSLLLRKIQTNRLELMDGDTDNWILYDDDETTPLLTFDVSDKDGNIIVQCENTPSRRSGAEGTISGSYTPDIYMRKAVYDPDDDGCVTCAENVSDGIYTSTASGVKYAVDNSHLPCILGTKCINESAIGDQLVVKYDAATDRLIYGLPNVSGSVSGTISHSWLLDLDGDDHLHYVPRTGIRGFTSTVSGVDPIEDYHLTTKQYVDNAVATISGGHDEHNELSSIQGGTSNQRYHLTGEQHSILTNTSGVVDASTQHIHGSLYYTKTEVDDLLGVNKSGLENLGNGDTETEVFFTTSFSGADYKLFTSLENTVDLVPSEYATTIIEKTASGFKVHYSGDIDSNNYVLNWHATLSGSSNGGAEGNYLDEVFDDKSPELGGDLVLGDYSAVLNTTPSGGVVSGYTVGWSGDISTMSVDLNDNGIGTPLHMKTNGHWEQCSAASGTTTIPCTAMALETGTGSKKILWRGIARKGAWSWTAGDIIYVSTVEGALTNTQPTSTGDLVQPLGVAIASDVIRFDPGLLWVEVE